MFRRLHVDLQNSFVHYREGRSTRSILGSGLRRAHHLVPSFRASWHLHGMNRPRCHNWHQAVVRPSQLEPSHHPSKPLYRFDSESGHWNSDVPRSQILIVDSQRNLTSNAEIEQRMISVGILCLSLSSTWTPRRRPRPQHRWLR